MFTHNLNWVYRVHESLADGLIETCDVFEGMFEEGILELNLITADEHPQIILKSNDVEESIEINLYFDPYNQEFYTYSNSRDVKFLKKDFNEILEYFHEELHYSIENEFDSEVSSGNSGVTWFNDYQLADSHEMEDNVNLISLYRIGINEFRRVIIENKKEIYQGEEMKSSTITGQEYYSISDIECLSSLFNSYVIKPSEKVNKIIILVFFESQTVSLKLDDGKIAVVNRIAGEYVITDYEEEPIVIGSMDEFEVFLYTIANKIQSYTYQNKYGHLELLDDDIEDKKAE
ncbi:hypothetical protein [Bacillus sp. AFS040349]|uniref:hypothetical protein n=1 Tax=Bacillus sp. AFS040349 TaxID=2033502 RepID=UPI000BFD36DF|nr:hypothetical protein [Bacillus sp. AFS040349]PGT83253.1 hypothetical protein COD11_13030 [Bacillus sp. AFS040349]